jgi:hypothetical protein
MPNLTPYFSRARTALALTAKAKRDEAKIFMIFP